MGSDRIKANIDTDKVVQDDIADYGPSWTCADCGSDSVQQVVYPATTNSAEEYDIECNDCSSVEIAESPEEAAHTLGMKLDECRAELDQLLNQGTKGQSK